MNSEKFHLIIDFEATCSDDGSLTRREMEIIEIGAVMLIEPTLDAIAEFQTFVKPIRYSQLTDFCKKLTHIRQEDVDNAPRFPEAIEKMKQWLSNYDNFDFCSWGDYDNNQLKQDCQLHQIGLPFYVQHRNLKTEFSTFLGVNKKYGVAQALVKVGLKHEGTPHRGIDDARSIAKIFQNIHTHNK